MNQISIWVLLVSSFLLFQATKSVENDVRSSLIEFYQKLSNSNGPVNPGFGWNSSSDPCNDNWKGIFCDNHTHLVRKIHLDALNFTGVFHSHIICNTQSLSSSISVISLHENRLRWANLEEISNCKQLTHLNIGRNLLSGSLPNSLAELNNLKFLDISWNYFWGDLPDLAQISGLQDFFAETNLLTGPLPDFNFQNFLHFNVSFNKFTGSIPNGGGNLSADSFIGNPELCGAPLPNKCPSPKSKSFSTEQILIFFGYFLIGFAVLFIIIFKLCKRSKTKEEKVDSVNKIADDSFYMQPSMASSEYKMGPNKSEISESGVVSSSLIVLTSPEVNGLKFDELLRAPAELIGRGKHGTVYKVIREQGMTLAVKRIRDWSISSDDFKERMKRLDQVKHPNVLPAVAFYCSKQEKLLVYEYLQNGSLCGLLSGTRTGRNFEWSSRLGFAATISNTLAFMHKELCKDKIAHGNLKSSNILLNKNMEPCITEYGLMEINNEDKPNNPCKSDIYGLGVILLELLTGKLVQTNGMDLAKWVLSVVQEEWTVEVFDKSLIQEGASEERMVNLLQIAVKCVNRSPEERPSINQVVMMINNLKEEEERSIVSESC